MALVEAQLVLATVAGRFRLRLASDRPVEAQALATLRPADDRGARVTDGRRPTSARRRSWPSLWLREPEKEEDGR